MSGKEKELWRKRSAVFVAEIKIGRVWVEHARADTYPEAEAEAKKASLDRSVSGVRVCEFRQTIVKINAWEQKRGPELATPKAMRDVHGKAPCPLCKKLARLKTDGESRWAFCVPCNRATPIRDESMVN